MSLMLADDYPLRTAADIGNYTVDHYLPEVFGDLSDSPSPLIRLSETEFLAADHPATVVNVQVDRQEVHGWSASTATDSTGHSYCKVTMSATVDAGKIVTAGIVGRASPSTGQTLEHPADIMAYILSVAGKDWDWSGLKAELPGLRLANRIDRIQSVRAWIDEIGRSCGVAWSAARACAYPAPPGVALAQLDQLNSTVESCISTVQDAAATLALQFSWNAAKSTYAKTMKFSASPSPFESTPPVPSVYVVAPDVTIQAPWLRSAADAEALGRRLLVRLSRPRASVNVKTGERLRSTDWATLSSPLLPIDGPQDFFVLSAQAAFGDRTSILTGEIAWGDVPTIALTSYSKMASDTQTAGVEIAYVAGVATFTIQDDQGKPLANANVSLDGGAAKKTDAQGIVRFSAKPGSHVLYVLAAGFAAFEIEVAL